MKCQNCGSEIPQGEFLCPFCGAEVRLVKDYSTVDYMLKEKELKEQEEQKKQEEEERAAREAAERLKPKPWMIAVKLILILIGSAALSFGVVSLIQYRNQHSAAFQKQVAITAFESRDYAKSRQYLDQALALDPDSSDLIILDARLLDAEDHPDDAEQRLVDYIETHPLSAQAYEVLVSLYEKHEKMDELVLLVQMMPEEIQSGYSRYLVEVPEFSLESGTYDFGTRLTMTASDDTVEIYYSTDGSTPTATTGILYRNPIILPLGTTTIRAVCVNELGAFSDVAEVTFQVNRVVPNLTQSKDTE